jgi:integrase
MPRTSRPPKYRLHRASGNAVVTLPDGSGGKRDFYLGRHGSAESKKEYGRLIAEWTAAGKVIPTGTEAASDLSVNEVLLKFWHHAKGYYRKPDRTHGELDNFKYSLRLLRQKYGHTRARDFGPLALKALRQSMVEAGLSRTTINRRVGRVRLVFRWAVGEGLVPPEVLVGLQAVAGLARGRTDAHETEPVAPVDDEVVDATLPHLSRHVAGIVRFMRLTGCRPGEACRLRRADIDIEGEVWEYQPTEHKGKWRGHARVIRIGPKAQAVLAEFPTVSDQDYVFSPARGRVERFALMREGRRTPVQPSQVCRARDDARRRPGPRYTPRSVHRAILVGTDKAGVERWHPNQLRHSAATTIRKTFGLEHAAATLGHTKLGTTQVYAEQDAVLAAEVAAAIG